MKIRFLLALVGLAISFALPIFAQQTDTVDPKTAQQIRALASKFDEEFNRNDAAAVAALYTDDAVFTTPNGTLNGRQAIEGLYRRLYFNVYHSKNDVHVVDEIIVAGNEVRVTGTWSDTFEEIDTIHANGTYSWVLVHEGDTWRIRASTFEITNERH
jgi:uncharacterized protein (TIGR02246 family)